jgi:hypothetical protein
LTAHANGFGFEGIFERQVQALGRPGRLLRHFKFGQFAERAASARICGRLWYPDIGLTGAKWQDGGGVQHLLARTIGRDPIHSGVAHYDGAHLVRFG